MFFGVRPIDKDFLNKLALSMIGCLNPRNDLPHLDCGAYLGPINDLGHDAERQHESLGMS